MRACSCNESLSNTGQTNCQPLFKVAKKLIFVPTYDGTGALNKLAVGTLFTPSLLTAKLNHATKASRWYPSPDLENVGGDRAESVFDTAPSGKKSFVKKGVRTMSFEIWDEGTEYLYQLEALRCADVSVYVVDNEGNIRGTVPSTEDGFLYPIKIDKASFDAKPIFATDTTVEKIMVNFDWEQSESDAQLRMITATDMTADLLNAEGLLDISIEYSTITQTSVIFTLQERFGSRKTRNKLTGLLISDFYDAVGGTASRLYNVTDSLAVTISTFAESTSSPGTYTLTFASQTVSDVIRVTPNKNGFDFTDTIADTFVIV